jgi:hypothetical protein
LKQESVSPIRRILSHVAIYVVAKKMTSLASAVAKIANAQATRIVGMSVAVMVDAASIIVNPQLQHYLLFPFVFLLA